MANERSRFFGLSIFNNTMYLAPTVIYGDIQPTARSALALRVADVLPGQNALLASRSGATVADVVLFDGFLNTGGIREHPSPRWR